MDRLLNSYTIRPYFSCPFCHYQIAIGKIRHSHLIKSQIRAYDRSASTGYQVHIVPNLESRREKRLVQRQ
jgi:hypothetical protein